MDNINSSWRTFSFSLWLLEAGEVVECRGRLVEIWKWVYSKYEILISSLFEFVNTYTRSTYLLVIIIAFGPERNHAPKKTQ